MIASSPCDRAFILCRNDARRHLLDLLDTVRLDVCQMDTRKPGVLLCFDMIFTFAGPWQKGVGVGSSFCPASGPVSRRTHPQGTWCRNVGRLHEIKHCLYCLKNTKFLKFSLPIFHRRLFGHFLCAGFVCWKTSPAWSLSS